MKDFIREHSAWGAQESTKNMDLTSEGLVEPASVVSSWVTLETRTHPIGAYIIRHYKSYMSFTCYISE